MKTLTVAVAVAAGIAVVAAQEFVQTEWQSCGFTNEEIRNRTDSTYLAKEDVDDFECTMVQVPLCYEGICESNKTIELFVKRKPATQKPADGQPQQSIWLLNGGPGDPHAILEPSMVELYYTLDSTVNVYSTDHRGTGLSNGFDCGVPQATMSLDQFAECVDKLLPEMDNKPAAYSVTSAAKDVEYLIDNLNNGEETYVYGASYGTYLTERLMHLAPETVKGYILDGVMSEEGADFTTRLNPVYQSQIHQPPAQRFFEYCAKSSDCPLKFDNASSDSPHDQILAMINALDDSPNECVNLLPASLAKDGPNKPSVLLRTLMEQLRTAEMSENIPYILHLTLTCNDEAKQKLACVMASFSPMFATSSASKGDEQSKSDGKTSEDGEVVVADAADQFNLMLRDLIAFSEMSADPTPSLKDVEEEYYKNLFGANTTIEIMQSCVFMEEKPDVCKSLGAPFHQSFQYDTDEYYNKTAAIPDNAGVLFLNGKLDFNTPSEYGDLEYDNMEGDNKISVSFDYGAHIVALGKDTKECSMVIMASFMKAHADTTQVDTSCAASAPAFDWTAQTLQKMVNMMNAESEATGETNSLSKRKHQDHTRSNHIHIRIKSREKKQEQEIHHEKYNTMKIRAKKDNQKKHN